MGRPRPSPEPPVMGRVFAARGVLLAALSATALAAMNGVANWAGNRLAYVLAAGTGPAQPCREVLPPPCRTRPRPGWPWRSSTTSCGAGLLTAGAFVFDATVESCCKRWCGQMLPSRPRKRPLGADRRPPARPGWYGAWRLSPASRPLRRRGDGGCAACGGAVPERGAPARAACGGAAQRPALRRGEGRRGATQGPLL